MKIAITGGIGSGKSKVLEILRMQGYNVVSADEVSAKLTKNNAVLKDLKKLFPDCLETVGDGLLLNKQKLSESVFNDKEKLSKLNNYLHPLIMENTLKEVGENGFAEVPLLFENGFEKLFDSVIVVLRDKEERISAVKNRSGLTSKQVVERMNNQIDYDNFNFSNYKVIVNNGSLEQLKNNVLKILDELKIKV